MNERWGACAASAADWGVPRCSTRVSGACEHNQRVQEERSRRDAPILVRTLAWYGEGNAWSTGELP